MFHVRFFDCYEEVDATWVEDTPIGHATIEGWAEWWGYTPETGTYIEVAFYPEFIPA